MTLAKRLALKYLRTKFALLSSVSKRKAAQKAFELFTTPQSRVKKKQPPVFTKAENLTFDFEGITIHGYRWNHAAEPKKKVLILHGYESSVINFDRYITPLVKKGYEVLAFDAPAHGQSGGKQIHALIYKKVILQIIDHYGPVTSFITHSFGGLALSLALEELPHDESWKAVLIAPATESVTAMNNFFKLMKLDSEVRKEFDTIITEVNNLPPSWYSVARAADQIRAQVLFLQDKKDRQTPFSDVKPIMKKNYPNFRFIITEGLGHSKIYRDPEMFQAIIDFF